MKENKEPPKSWVASAADVSKVAPPAIQKDKKLMKRLRRHVRLELHRIARAGSPLTVVVTGASRRKHGC